MNKHVKTFFLHLCNIDAVFITQRTTVPITLVVQREKLVRRECVFYVVTWHANFA